MRPWQGNRRTEEALSVFSLFGKGLLVFLRVFESWWYLFRRSVPTQSPTLVCVNTCHLHK